MFPEFLQHQANKTCGRFFPSLYEEYLNKWPPILTEEELSKAKGNVAVATAKARGREEHVRASELTALLNG